VFGNSIDNDELVGLQNASDLTLENAEKKRNRRLILRQRKYEAIQFAKQLNLLRRKLALARETQ